MRKKHDSSSKIKKERLLNRKIWMSLPLKKPSRRWGTKSLPRSRPWLVPTRRSRRSSLSLHRIRRVITTRSWKGWALWWNNSVRSWTTSLPRKTPRNSTRSNRILTRSKGISRRLHKWWAFSRHDWTHHRMTPFTPSEGNRPPGIGCSLPSSKLCLHLALSSGGKWRLRKQRSFNDYLWLSAS